MGQEIKRADLDGLTFLTPDFLRAAGGLPPGSEFASLFHTATSRIEETSSPSSKTQTRPETPKLRDTQDPVRTTTPMPAVASRMTAQDYVAAHPEQFVGSATSTSTASPHIPSSRHGVRTEKPKKPLDKTIKPQAEAPSQRPARNRKVLLPSLAIVAVVGMIGAAQNGDSARDPGFQSEAPQTTPESSENVYGEQQGQRDQPGSGVFSGIEQPSGDAPVDVTPVTFTVPPTIEIGDEQGCVELVRPSISTTRLTKNSIGQPAEKTTSLLQAELNNRIYYFELPEGGVDFVLKACGVSPLALTAKPTEKVSAAGVQQQEVFADLSVANGFGQRLSGDEAVSILSWDQTLLEIKGVESMCSELTKDPENTENSQHPDCTSVTSLTQTQQLELRAAALYSLGSMVREQCTPTANKALRRTTRSVVKDTIMKQNVQGMERSDVMVEFPDSQLSFLQNELTAQAQQAASLGAREQLPTLFPNLTLDKVLITGCKNDNT